jgi:hypothetical protein
LGAGGGGARLFEDVAAVLAGEVERQPVVLVVDDVDVVDDVAVDLLVFVAEQLRFRPLVVLVTARDRRRLERLCRAATVIVLQGLAPSAVRELLASQGVLNGDEIAPSVMRLTGGLPGEVIVLARELSSRRGVDVDDVVRVALSFAASIAHTEGRAASDALTRRLIAARDLGTPRARGELAMFVHRHGGTTSTTADERVKMIEEPLAA